MEKKILNWKFLSEDKKVWDKPEEKAEVIF